MKKWLSILIVGIFIVSGFGTVATNVSNTGILSIQTRTDTVSVDVSSIQVTESVNDYLLVRLGDQESYLLNPGQPMVPRIIKHYELPFGVTNVEVDAQPLLIQEQAVAKQIRPAPAPVSYSQDTRTVVHSEKDSQVYSSDALYPDAWAGFHVGCGLNANGKHVTLVTVNLFPVRYRPVSGELQVAQEFSVSIRYQQSSDEVFPAESTYDLVIITPEKFSTEVQRLADHKISMGVPTVVKTTEDIYAEYTGYDKPEQIKYFIKDALETWGVTYVLLFGGLKSNIIAKAKDDINQGSKAWYLPIRYSNFQWDGDESYNFTSGEPGYISDLYYADVYKEGGVFDDWDSNGNNVFAEWSGELRDELDLYPDVAYGRLACRSTREAKNVIDKIINYEKEPADPSWFDNIIVISGDGFLDQEDWNIQWDTTGLPNGQYTIFAQSFNPEEGGPIDEIHITLDKTVASNITFNHDDHLNPALADGYPAPPIAEIVSVSNNNTLGNTDYTYAPNDGEAYCNDLYKWADISYVAGVLTIRGKCYDPRPYGNLTDLVLWIEDEDGTTVFDTTREHMETYYEGEWVVGEKLLHGRGGALKYMPDFESNIVFTSNGKWFDQNDVINEFSNGYGFAYFSGHGSPGWWGDHYPGIPGNRRYGQVPGLLVMQADRYFPFLQSPVLPMRKLTNTDKLPVTNVGGCHNSMFSVSMIPCLLDGLLPMNMFTYGTPLPDCWGWYMMKMPHTGSIATMGNTGYGWGSEGDVCTIGPGDGWLNTEFYRQYGQENQTVLGMAYIQAITGYISNFKTWEYSYWRVDHGWDGIDQKTVQQWELLGDPSLQIGGYS
ncbi:MAG TPA: C25 family cysteine peptidase [Candidatus Thermoplasmatota archaeon]|nr:C25 family cysteine peptidase [Candidatus Thermoplasmatota archaeon]